MIATVELSDYLRPYMETAELSKLIDAVSRIALIAVPFGSTYIMGELGSDLDILALRNTAGSTHTADEDAVVVRLLVAAGFTPTQLSVADYDGDGLMTFRRGPVNLILLSDVASWAARDAACQSAYHLRRFPGDTDTKAGRKALHLRARAHLAAVREICPWG